MNMLILKTDIKSKRDFVHVEDSLRSYYHINECTIDLEDRDKVLRITGNDLNQDEIISKVNGFGFCCEDLL